MKTEMEAKLVRYKTGKDCLAWPRMETQLWWSTLSSLPETLVFNAENPTCQEVPISGTLGWLITIWVFWLQPGLSSESSVHAVAGGPVEEELFPSEELQMRESCHPRTGVCAELGHT